MARITVEDCLENVANRFELVMLASKRARQLMRGSVDPTVPWENDKATVVALREIANGHTDFSDSHQVDMSLTHPAQPQPHVVVQAITIETIEITETEDDDTAEDASDESTQAPSQATEDDTSSPSE